MVPTEARLRNYIKSLTLIVLLLLLLLSIPSTVDTPLPDEALVINTNLHISMMCTGGVSHQESAPPSKLGAWQPLLSIHRLIALTHPDTGRA